MGVSTGVSTDLVIFLAPDRLSAIASKRGGNLAHVLHTAAPDAPPCVGAQVGIHAIDRDACSG